MKAFEYAAPRTEDEVLGLLGSQWGSTEILAGGTDLMGLMKKLVVTPDRVVNIKEVASLRGIEADSQALRIGATTTLDDLLESPALADFPALAQAIQGINSLQLQAQGTLGGELCQRPRCWYFRAGHGLLADRGRLVAQGDSRYHAIFATDSRALFVNGSRLAPALIALNAQVRLIGPGPRDETLLPLARFYRIPRNEQERETVLRPDQLLTHIILPRTDLPLSATYEVRHGAGPDYPLLAAAVALRVARGLIHEAHVVLGQAAPVPWVSQPAREALVGQRLDAAVAEAAGAAAASEAQPLADNAYKVQLAQVAVKRAVLRAAGLPLGGFE